MAHRMTNNGSDWGYQQPVGRGPGAPSNYGPPYPGPPYQQNMSHQSAADPWNWGWEEPNGSSESNNNAQNDPKWDWSVDAASGGYQEHPGSNTNMHYPPPAGQQMWPNHYPQHYPPYTQQVPNTLDVISDSFNTSSVVNQNTYSQNQTLFQTVGKNSKHTHGFVSNEHQDNLSYGSNNKGDEQKHFNNSTASENQQYFLGFHQQESAHLAQQAMQNDMYMHPAAGDSAREGVSAVPSPSAQVPSVSMVEGVPDPQSGMHHLAAGTEAADVSAFPDAMPRSGKHETEALSPQWSTESLPSQGSDETSHATDSSANNTQSDTPTIPNDSSAIHSPHPHETLDPENRMPHEHSPNHLLTAGPGLQGSQSYLPGAPGLPVHRPEKSLGATPPSTYHSPELYYSNHPSEAVNLNGEYRSKVVESSPMAGSSSFPLDIVSENLQSLSLGSVTPDVENVEIAPPEPPEKSLPPPPPSSGVSLPPPPLCAPVPGVKSANPYAAKGSSLNHKYGNKRRAFAPSEGSGDGVAYNKHMLPVSHPQGDGENSAVGSQKERVSSPSPNAPPRLRPTPAEEQVNLETVPDNKERPDVDMLHERKSASPAGGHRYHQLAVGQSAAPVHPSSWSQEHSLPDNQEVYSDMPSARPRNLSPRESAIESPGRGGYQWQRPSVKDVHHMSMDSELDRVVPGQGEESVNLPPQMTQTFSLSPANNIMEDIALRQVPGHQDSSSVPLQTDANSTVEDISARAVPGGLVSGEDLGPVSGLPGTLGPAYLQRSVPGQNNGSPSPLQNSTDALAAQGEDDIPPPGLSRMVPGESRGPEGQGSNEPSQAALDEPRVVTGLAEEGNQSSGPASINTSVPFQPIPDEPRVVTGVAQDELDNNLATASSPVSTSSLPSDGQETTDLDAERPDSIPTLAQLPSERSETIGSDCVESFPAVLSDVPSRRDMDSQRRSAEDLDSSAEVGRHSSGRDYYGGKSSRDRDLGHDHSSEGRRYRDERDGRHYDRDEHMYERHEHDQDKSPRGRRYPYSREHARYDDQEYSQRRHYEEQSRHGRRFKRMEEDGDPEEYGGDRDMDGEQKHHKHDRERMPPEKPWYRDEDYDRYNNRRPRDAGDREYRDRDRNHDRDRDRERERDRDRDRYDRGRQPYDRDYRRPEEYYGHHEDYYGHRSRPSSRSGSRPEYEDDRRRDYHNYGGYYYNSRMTYDEYNYRYYLAWQQYMQQQQRLQQPQPQPHMSPHVPTMPEDRGSVHSGRSSTHEELTRHNIERSTEHNVSMLGETTSSATPQRFTPAKFSTAHVKGILTRHGQLVKILPHYPLDGQSATVEIHDVQQILVPAPELKLFPGPLIKGVTHKKSLMNFCMRKIKAAENDPNLLERDSVVLLWRLLLLLLRQNGTVVGTDIAELLLSGAPSDVSGSGNLLAGPPATAVSRGQMVSPAVSASGASGTEMEEIATPTVAASKALSEEELTNNFREFLLYGNTQEALEWAMKHGLWGHALFLASKMDNRTYATVMTRFANGLTLNDPLQTLYQLMSGRLPAAVTCCADERWGDWRPHLAMILSNSTTQPDLDHRAITTLGDTLASRGCLYASHFCYLMAQLEFGFYNQKASKLVLLGSSHTKPFNEFATNEAIQMTEIYIYACQLADPEFELPQFQGYKLLYALRLLEAGMITEALQYVEAIARTIGTRPSVYSLDFMQQVFEQGNKLKVHDLSYASNSAGESEDPQWLLHLRNIIEDCMSGVIQPDGPSYGSTSNLSLSEGESLQPQVMPEGLQHQGNQSLWPQDQVDHHHQHHQYHDQQQQQHSDQEQQSGYNMGVLDSTQLIQDHNMASFGANTAMQQNNHTGWQSGDVKDHAHPEAQNDAQKAAQQYWSSNQWDNHGIHVSNDQQETLNPSLGYDPHLPAVSATGESSPGEKPPFHNHPLSNYSTVERSAGETSAALHPHQPISKPRPIVPAKGKSKKENKTAPATASSSWFGGLWNKLALRPKNQMILPEDKEPKIVWSAEKQRWINTEGDEDEDSGDLPPPPKASELPVGGTHMSAPVTSNGDVAMPPPGGQNMYKMNRARGSRANYVDVFGGVKTAAPSVPAPDLFPTVGQASLPSNLFIPAPVQSDDGAPVDFLTSSSAVAADNSLGGESSEDGSGHTQQFYGGPPMYNPSNVGQFAMQQNTSNLGKKRYPN